MDDNRKDNIPYVVFESALAREERHNKRLVSIILTIIVFWFLTIVGCIWYISLPVETYSEVTQEAEDTKCDVVQHIGDSYGEDKTN